MVRAVHANLTLAGNLGQQASRCQMYFVNTCAAAVHPPMIQNPPALRGQVGNQRATQRDIEDLLSATNRQQRFALPEYFIHQHQLAQVPRATIGTRADRAAQAGRKAVSIQAAPCPRRPSATRRHSARRIQPSTRARARRQRQGNPPAVSHSAQVGFRKADREVAELVSLLLDVRGNEDQRRSGHLSGKPNKRSPASQSES